MFPYLSLVGQTCSPALNWHHWLRLCCYATHCSNRLVSLLFFKLWILFIQVIALKKWHWAKNVKTKGSLNENVIQRHLLANRTTHRMMKLSFLMCRSNSLHTWMNSFNFIRVLAPFKRCKPELYMLFEIKMHFKWVQTLGSQNIQCTCELHIIFKHLSSGG